MFDFSFGEIGLIAVVALVVLGPERLPKVARTAGALVRRARTSWQSVKDEIERELEAEDLKRSFSEARQAASDLRSEMQRTSNDIEASAREATHLGKVDDPTGPADTTSAPPPEPLAAPLAETPHDTEHLAAANVSGHATEADRANAEPR